MAGVHRLQHVERFFAADLADDDAIGPHTQGVDDELSLPDRALALDVRRPRLEPDDVALPQRQFGSVFDRDDAFLVRNEARQRIQQRRLAGAGSARDDDVQPRGDRALEEIEHRLRQRLAIDQILRADAIGAETANRQHGTVERERRNDRVDAGAVLQPGVDHRAGLVDAPSDHADDALDDPEQVRVVLEDDLRLFEAPFALDVHLIVPVDQDVRDVRILEQRFERPEAEDLVQNVGDERNPARRG